LNTKAVILSHPEETSLPRRCAILHFVTYLLFTYTEYTNIIAGSMSVLV